MRKRKDIEADIGKRKTADLILEVLLDLRDLERGEVGEEEEEGEGEEESF